MKETSKMEAKIYVPLVLIAFAAIVTLCYVFVLFRKVSRIKIGDKKVEELQKYICQIALSGALDFLKA